MRKNGRRGHSSKCTRDSQNFRTITLGVFSMAKSQINIKVLKKPTDILFDLLYTEIKIDSYIEIQYLDIRQDRRVGYWQVFNGKADIYKIETRDFAQPYYPEYSLHDLFVNIT